MKIAKKVLAVVMAVAMIACLSAMAFATDTQVSLKVGEVKDGKFKVELVTSNADLQAANWIVNYDATTLNCVTVKAAAGVTQAILDGNFSQAINNLVDGEVQVGCTFMNDLGTDVGADGEVVLFYMDFEVEDANATSVAITLTGDAADSATVVLKEEETTAAPEEETTAAPEEDTTAAPEEDTTAAVVTPEDESTTNKTEGVPAGDTGVLAIAAGVVALAGAAFVVSKKRK